MAQLISRGWTYSFSSNSWRLSMIEQPQNSAMATCSSIIMPPPVRKEAASHRIVIIVIIFAAAVFTTAFEARRSPRPSAFVRHSLPRQMGPPSPPPPSPSDTKGISRMPLNASTGLHPVLIHDNSILSK